MNQRICIVGGGVAGLASAALLAEQGSHVTIVEAEATLGGLLRSRRYPELGTFDYGTHVLEDTGIAELDRLLFSDACHGWNEHQVCPSGCFFSGVLSSSGFVDARALPNELYSKAFAELLALPRPPHIDELNLPDFLRQTYGPIITQQIFSPIFKKLYGGRELSEIAREALALFGLKRIVCGSAEDAARLKQDNPWHDERLAFHDPRIGARQVRHLYPKAGGIGQWAQQLERNLRDRGVSIRSGARITSIAREEARVSSLTLSNQETIEFDSLVWTAPTGLLIKLAAIDGLAGNFRPSFCQTVLLDLVMDHPVHEGMFYVTCPAPELKSFRVTLYDNLQGNPGASPSRVTVEAMAPAGDYDVSDITPHAIFDELKQMGLVDGQASLLGANSHTIPISFPVLTPAFIDAQNEARELVTSTVENVTLLGKASGNAFFMSDVLHETYRLLGGGLGFRAAA